MKNPVERRSSAVSFNIEQAKAIETINKNVGLVAGAGTGKTLVLINRFVNIIEKSNKSPLEAMESILAITFTEKATKEMLSRVDSLIRELAVKDSKYLELEKYIPFANISTIDSFCMEIIRENSLKIGLNPEFGIMEEYEGKSILNDIAEEILSERLKTSQFLSELMISKNKNRIRNISEIFIKAYTKVVGKGYDIYDLLEQTKKYYGDVHIKIESKTFIEEIQRIFQELSDLKMINKGNKKAYAILDSVNELDMDNHIFSREDAGNLCSKLKVELQKPKKVDKSVLTDSFKIFDNFIFGYEVNDVALYEEIVDILNEIDIKFKGYKLKEGKLQFSDLIYYANKILDYPDILSSYQNNIQYVMVDEFQDTNYTQKELIFKLCSVERPLDRNNLFVVGDPKQSIYGFRGSDLRVFRETIKDIEASKGEIIVLKDNYRSSENLVSFANELFGDIMGDDYSPLIANVDAKNYPIEIIGPHEDAFEEAEVIASRVQQLVQEGYGYGNIAILFRTTGKLKKLEEVFSKYKIPYVNPKSKEFFNKREIRDILLFLNFLNTPEDNEALYGLLKSNFFLIEDDVIFSILRDNDLQLYKNLISYKGENIKVKRAKKILSNSISIVNEVNVYELLNNFISETKYYELLGAISQTPQPIENVRKYEDITLEYVNRYSGFLNQFMDYIDDISSEDMNEAMVDIGDKAVKFMTIHASKGLEFPVVILYDSTNNGGNNSPDIEISPDMGLALKLGEVGTLFDKIRNERIVEDLAEGDRVLYVAFTRAKERFILSYKKTKDDEASGGSEAKHFYGKITSRNYDYKYNTDPASPIVLDIENKVIHTDESEIKEYKFTEDKQMPISSISAYSVYKRCPREYFYNYKLKLGDFDYHEVVSSEEDIDLEISESPGGALFGTFIHDLISNYSNEVDEDTNFRLALRKHGIDENIKNVESARKLFSSFKNNYHHGDSIHEYNFMIKFDSGYLSGSIDEVRFLEDDEIQIIDYKTNRVKNLNKLIQNYEPQILLYSIAIKDIYGKLPKQATLHFLETNDLIDIELNPEKLETLRLELNLFLSFISNNDNIDGYPLADTCNDYCRYKDFCDRNKNDKGYI